MATIEDAVSSGRLIVFEVPVDIVRLPIRLLYMSQELYNWADGTLAYDTKKLGGRTAQEHLEAAFIDFRCDPRIHHGDLKRMMPTSEGVWKMHVPMLRIYGWCPRQSTFVAVYGELASSTKKDRGLNDRRQKGVLTFIKRLRLDSSQVLYGEFPDVFPY